MRVEPMQTNKGNPAANQFIMDDEAGRTWFQSYNTIIVFKYNDRVCLDKKYWNYSKTTAKYRNKFLGESTAETKKKIESGEYILTNLN